jgi:hypothetical protein
MSSTTSGFCRSTQSLQNYTGIVKYKGKHYIFDLFELLGLDSDPGSPELSLRLDGYARFGRQPAPRLGPVCVYSTIKTQPK